MRQSCSSVVTNRVGAIQVFHQGDLRFFQLVLYINEMVLDGQLMSKYVLVCHKVFENAKVVEVEFFEPKCFFDNSHKIYQD